MLRLSSRSMFRIVRLTPRFALTSPKNVTAILSYQFNQALVNLLYSLRSEAASGNSLRKFAVGKTSVMENKIYAFVQCTPDLSELNCTNCLGTIIGRIQYCCNDKEGTRIYAPSCKLRFASNSFFDHTVVQETTVLPPPVSPPPMLSKNSTTLEGNDDNISRRVIIIAVPAAVFVILIVVSICIIFRVKNFKEKITKTIHHCLAPSVKDVKEMPNTESLHFDSGTIRAATDNFSEEKIIGQGTFGVVYKGTLPDGQQVAVKRLFMNSKQRDEDFKNEVTLVAGLQHRNLVRLLGFCLEGKERILVFEFLPNSSLDNFIFDPIKRGDLDWERRYRIIEGISRGLLYLHEDSRLRIIHRDLKASNILLDSEMNPKISDFGTARLFEMDQTHIITNRVVGTRGYMAPEYIIHHHVSVKSDVFGFGVLVLELVSGQRRSFCTEREIECLLTNAWKKWNEGTASNLIDPALREGSRSEMMKFIHIGLLCVQESASDRPTMASVIHMLNNDSAGTLPAPSKPGFFMQGSVILNASSSLEHNSTGLTESDRRRIATAPLTPSLVYPSVVFNGVNTGRHGMLDPFRKTGQAWHGTAK
ncbi:hypothetical protein Dsin_027803 [Dipteronia sinensis]|uniref:Cysteine-rich receptor-like protein kinase 29 n=1 Tax=Dipteronia sinensis TaxID=43782 RepID=A0AAD9ZQL4_9ROSI|nr:hypothetical protein Dsin_027803 [Dipteronia sinensis]